MVDEHSYLDQVTIARHGIFSKRTHGQNHAMGKRSLGRRNETGEMSRHELPAYQRIIDRISGVITSERMGPGSPLPSERQLCLDFGVARATVARAMRELERAGMIERRRGQGTFVADAQGSILPASTLVCIVPQLRGPFITGIIQGIEKATRQAGHYLVLANSACSVELEAEHLEQARRRAQGAILWPMESQANIGLIDDLRKSGFPLVLVDRTLPGLVADSVVADNYSAGYLLTNSLFDQGHERIAFVNGEETVVSSVAERLRGYRDAYRAKGIPFQPHWMSTVPYGPNIAQEQRYDCVARLLAHQPRPTAFITMYADILIALLHDLLHFGIRIPEDVALATTDNTDGDELLRLATASVAFDCAAMGTQAVRLLLNRQRLGTALAERQMVIPVALHRARPVSVRIARDFGYEGQA
jgi:GntR family transcriptional regulator, arabinose operon transcriptional repressor